MKVQYFGDDLGLIMYIFTECTSMDVALYLIENNEIFKTYRITKMTLSRKYWFFGAYTIKIIAETEEAIKRYGGNGKEPVYKLFTS